MQDKYKKGQSCDGCYGELLKIIAVKHRKIVQWLNGWQCDIEQTDGQRRQSYQLCLLQSESGPWECHGWQNRRSCSPEDMSQDSRSEQKKEKVRHQKCYTRKVNGLGKGYGLWTVKDEQATDEY